jgi:hypothetical protein
MQLFRRERQFIRKKGDITGIIYKSGIFMRMTV